MSNLVHLYVWKRFRSSSFSSRNAIAKAIAKRCDAAIQDGTWISYGQYTALQLMLDKSDFARTCAAFHEAGWEIATELRPPSFYIRSLE